MSTILLPGRRRAAAPIAMAALAITMLTCTGLAHAQELWTLGTGGDILFQRVTALGSLLVSTEVSLRAVEPKTGKTLWMRDDVKKLRTCDYLEVTKTPYGLLDLTAGVGGSPRRIEAIDLETGRTIWDSQNLPMNSSLGVFQVPHKKMLIIAGSPNRGSKSVLLGVDATTGRLMWQQDSLFDEPLQLFEAFGSGKVFKRYSIDGNQAPLFDTPNTAILYLNEEGPVKIDLDTGNRLWVADQLKGTAPPALRNGYAGMLLDKRTVFVPCGQSLQAIDADSGAPLWKADREFLSPVAQMELVSQGLIVRGTPQVDPKGKLTGKPFIDLLDLKTGLSLWRKPFEELDKATAFDVYEDNLYFATKAELVAIDLTDGTAHPVARYRFRGHEAPTTLEVMDCDYLLSSNQNMMMLDEKGGQKYFRYYAAPSAWTKMASTPPGTPARIASAQGASSPALAEGEAPYYTPIIDNPKLSKRLKASSDLSHCTSILTTVESNGHKGPGLVKVEKFTGKEVARLLLGKKTPRYEIDPIEARVFLIKSDNQIVCYEY